jgi:pimeloyl-ACP methyl ester carboxylesterase
MAHHLIDRMLVEVDGEGDAVVCVHGLGGTTNTWTPLLPALRGCKVVRIEMPGSGRSHRAYALAASSPLQGRLSIDALVAAVLRVCGQLGVERAHFAGHSLGTIVCQHLAAREPRRVKSLSLFGALAAPADAARAALRSRAELARSQGMYPIADAIVKNALSNSTRETLPVVVAFVRESLLAQDAEGYARTCEALAAAQAAPVEAIRCPVLMVSADEDVVAPVQGARALAARLVEARVEVLPRCGHWMPVERPAECQRLLREFLARQGASVFASGRATVH